MKYIITILLFYSHTTLFSQTSSQKGGVRDRIEAAVDQGLITREQADERYTRYRAKLAGTRTERRDPIMENHYERLGVNDLSLIKNGLLDQGIPASQLDAVLGGMLRLVHAAKIDGKNFKMNPRIEVYFKDRIGLTDLQTEYVMGYSRKIAAGN